MEPFVVDTARASYLVGTASLQVPSDAAAATDLAADDLAPERSNPYLQWIAGNFVESDKPNSNRQFWTARDLAMSEYSIKYAPMNMIHKFQTPVGFFAKTKRVPLVRQAPVLSLANEQAYSLTTTNGTGPVAFNGQWSRAAAEPDPLKIQVLGGLWTHLFPQEAALVEMADAQKALYFSMECRGSHLKCAGDDGCGETFEYQDVTSHCEHLQKRTSVRHIVNPMFHGGALIIPPTRPGWKEATASVVTQEVVQEAARYAEQHEAAYRSMEADGVSITASAWEQLMAMVLSSRSA